MRTPPTGVTLSQDFGDAVQAAVRVLRSGFWLADICGSPPSCATHHNSRGYAEPRHAATIARRLSCAAAAIGFAGEAQTIVNHDMPSSPPRHIVPTARPSSARLRQVLSCFHPLVELICDLPASICCVCCQARYRLVGRRDAVRRQSSRLDTGVCTLRNVLRTHAEPACGAPALSMLMTVICTPPTALRQRHHQQLTRHNTNVHPCIGRPDSIAWLPQAAAGHWAYKATLHAAPGSPADMANAEEVIRQRLVATCEAKRWSLQHLNRGCVVAEFTARCSLRTVAAFLRRAFGAACGGATVVCHWPDGRVTALGWHAGESIILSHAKR